MHHLSQITDTPQGNPALSLQEEICSSLHQFLSSPQENYFETQIKKQGTICSLRASVFEDRSFEVILTDITQHEKTKQIPSSEIEMCFKTFCFSS